MQEGCSIAFDPTSTSGTRLDENPKQDCVKCDTRLPRAAKFVGSHLRCSHLCSRILREQLPIRCDSSSTSFNFSLIGSTPSASVMLSSPCAGKRTLTVLWRTNAGNVVVHFHGRVFFAVRSQKMS